MSRMTKDEERTARIQFGMWLGIPPQARKSDEKTLEQIAKKIGTARETLSRWKEDETVVDIANNAIKMLAGNEELEILNGIIDEAKNGKGSARVAAQRLYLEYMNKIGTRKGEKNELPTKFSYSFTVDD